MDPTNPNRTSEFLNHDPIKGQLASTRHAGPLRVTPPLINSANPWCTTEADLLGLYHSPYTGAVTIRTSLWEPFKQKPETHQYTFLSTITGHATTPIVHNTYPSDEPGKIDAGSGEGRGIVKASEGEFESSSLNTLGYSPIAFEEYLCMLIRMNREGKLIFASNHSGLGYSSLQPKAKPFVVSVSGTEDEVGRCAKFILRAINDPDSILPPREGEKDESRGAKLDLLMEINLSCPNIPGKAPPAYDESSLTSYLYALSQQLAPFLSDHPSWAPIHLGIKTPPYTHAGQFRILLDTLESSTKWPGGCPLSFITATNTLGSCLVLDSSLSNPALGSVHGTGIGGLAGDALHPLALGNVKTIRDMLDQSKCAELEELEIIGIGGVKDADGFRRMRNVGASVVGVGTALGREGVGIFEKIEKGMHA